MSTVRGLGAPSLPLCSLLCCCRQCSRPVPRLDVAEYDYIKLGCCDLLLPAPEFDYIKSQAAGNDRVVLPMSGGECRVHAG